MSRVAKIPVTLGKGVEASIADGVITVKGPKGTLTQKLDASVEVKVENGHVYFKALEDTKQSNAMSGTLRALVNAMNIGVTRRLHKETDSGRCWLPCSGSGRHPESEPRFLSSGCSQDACWH